MKRCFLLNENGLLEAAIILSTFIKVQCLFLDILFYTELIKNTKFSVQTDVVGTCNTQYIPIGIDWEGAKITKVKDMSTCLKNQKLNQYALNIPDLNIQHLPMVR